MKAMPAIALLYGSHRQAALTCQLTVETEPIEREAAAHLGDYYEEYRFHRVAVTVDGQPDPLLTSAMATGAACARRCLQTMGLAYDEHGMRVKFTFDRVSIQDASAGLLAALALAIDRADAQRCRALPPAYAATGRVTLAGQVQRVASLGPKLEQACACTNLPPGSKIFYPQEQEDELMATYPQVAVAAQANSLRLCPVSSVEEAMTWLLLDRPLYTAPHLGRFSRLSALSHLEYSLSVLTNSYHMWLVECFRAAVAAAVADNSLARLAPNAVNQLCSLTPVDVLVLHYVHTLTLAKERAAAEDIVQTLNFLPGVIASALTTLCTAEVLVHQSAQEGYRTTDAGRAVITHYRAIRESTLIPALALLPSDERRVAEAAHVLHWLAVGYAKAALAAPTGPPNDPTAR